MIPKDDTVYLQGLSADGWWAAFTADQVHKSMIGREAVITSAKDGRHRVERSAHYRGDAIDVRIWYTDKKNKTEAYTEALRKELGPDYVVLLEIDHIHIHWSPTQ